MRDLALTARFFNGEEALHQGLVSHCAPNDEACFEWALAKAKEIASKSPVAVAATKRSLIFSRDHTVKEGLEHIAMLNSVML